MKKKFTQFKWFAAMIMLVAAMVMPSTVWADDVVTYTNGFGSDGSYQEATLTTGTYDIDDDGIKDNVYEIGNAGQLYWFAALVNGTDGLTQNLGANAVLTANITVNSELLKNLNDDGTAKEGYEVRNWTPISTDDENPYTGIFDGKGYKISGLYFNNTNGSYYIGLFGYVGSGSKICNVGIVDSYFNGCSGIGGVCGYCTSGEITNCYNKGTVIGTGSNIGGVCGYSSGTITDCYNTGNVTGTSTSDQEGFVGGVCGCNNGYRNMSTITRSYNSGKVSGGYYVGGMCGANGVEHYAQTVNCYNTGEVTGTYDVGGICGFNGSYIEKCYNSAAVSGGSYVGSICGFNSSTITTCYYLRDTATVGINNGKDVSGSAESKTPEHFKSGEVAWLLNGGKTDGSQAWYQNLSAESGDAYPVLTRNGSNTVYGGYNHGGNTGKFSNTASDISEEYRHPHAYDFRAADEANGNHDKSYQGVFNWVDIADKTDATVNAKFTCTVCGKIVTQEAMTVEHDDEYNNTAATCTEVGYNYFKTSYAFKGATITDSYKQTVPDLGHNMNAITFIDAKKIYSNQCQREGCGYIGYYATSNGSVEAKYEGGVYKVTNLCMNDGLAYDSKAQYTVTSLAYKRTFSHDKWVAVYVPFEINCDNLANDFEMAVVNNFHEYEQTDGSYNVVLEVKRMTSGTIPALTPCVMRLKTKPASATEKEIQLSNVPFSAAADNYIDCSSVTRYYKFTGSLAGKAANSLNGETDFVLNKGTLHKANTETTLKAQRWYLTATDRNGSSTSATMLRSITLRVIGDSDGDVTGIEDVHVVTEKATSARDGIFDLQGRRLNSEPTNGIYIKNGVKYVK